MGNKPFFSIVLPTLNRAAYLPFAIQSVLNQSFDDFELLVSDNSSTDTTEQVVRSFSDKRVKYVKTEKVVPMYESWEFALNNANGEYITFLGDDDAHSQIYLESLKKIIEDHKADIVACKMADYYYNSESFVTYPFSNKLFIYEASKAIKNLFIHLGLTKGSVSEQIQMPLLLNTVYHNTVFTKIKNKLGKVFPNVLSGDYYLSIVTLSFVKNYYYFDAPLSFHGMSNFSTTSSITSQEKDLSLKKTQPELTAFKKVPFEFSVPYNYSADALLLAKSDLGKEIDYVDVDLTGYFVRMHQHLHASELRGNNISMESKELTDIISRQDFEIQRHLQSLILSKKKLLKNKFRINFYNNSLYQFLSKLRNPDKSLVFEGKVNNFSNIVECAGFVDFNFLNRYAIKGKTV